MSDYARQHDFSTKTGTTIFGSEVDDEFDALVTAVASKTDESREGSASGIATLDGSALIPVGISGNATSGGGQVPEATATALGAVELATTAEITTGTDASRVVTAAELKTHIDALMTAAAGSGLAESSRVLSVDLNELGTETTIAAGDFIAMVDITDNGSQKITFANLEATLNHDSLAGFVANEHINHSSVSITAGTGLTGGGTIAANRTINVATAGSASTNPIVANADDLDFAIDGLTTMEGNALQATDTFIVDDGGTPKGIEYQDMGLRVQAGSGTQTLAAADMNTIMEFNAAATVTIPLNATTALPIGSAVILVVDNASANVTVTAAASVTLNSIHHPGGAAAASDVVQPGGTACLIKVATDEWYLSGDIADS